jgi:hypothetical protein
MRFLRLFVVALLVGLVCGCSHPSQPFKPFRI